MSIEAREEAVAMAEAAAEARSIREKQLQNYLKCCRNHGCTDPDGRRYCEEQRKGNIEMIKLRLGQDSYVSKQLYGGVANKKKTYRKHRNKKHRLKTKKTRKNKRKSRKSRKSRRN